MIFGTSLFWRETHKPSKLLIFDGRVVVLLLLALMHMRIWTVALAFFAMFILWWFDRKGVPADAIVRFLRSAIVGRKRSARGLHEERTAVTFSHEPKAYLNWLEGEKIMEEKVAQKKAPKQKRGSDVK
jgi:predicted acetyltransferase